MYMTQSLSVHATNGDRGFAGIKKYRLFCNISIYSFCMIFISLHCDAFAD